MNFSFFLIAFHSGVQFFIDNWNVEDLENGIGSRIQRPGNRNHRIAVALPFETLVNESLGVAIKL
jgi:hypothetical protein